MGRILIIEDNLENLELMTYLLQAFGHETIVARDGEEGMEEARKERPDLILCDVQLPKRDGYQIARELKADPILRQMPLVAVTALAMVGDREKLLAAGFDGYISKPIAPEELAQEITEYLPRPSGTSLDQTPSNGPEGNVAAGRAEHLRGRGARLLVVDDSRENRELTRAIFEPFDYLVTLAGSGAEALAALAEGSFELILSDLHMPDFDGLRLLETLKADPRLASIPFVMLTSTARGYRARERALGLGALRVLSRPLEPEQLLAVVKGCLAEASKRRS